MTIWYLIRAFGMVALIALSASATLGIISTRAATTVPTADRRVVLQLVHRSTSLLGLLALVAHIALTIADKYVAVSLTGALVPFAAGYRPVAVGMGTIATYILITVAVSGLMRGRFAGTRTGLFAWKAVHATAYAGWALAIGHGVVAGSDSNAGWALATYIGCASTVAATAAWRFLTPQPRRVRDPRGHQRLIPTGGHR